MQISPNAFLKTKAVDNVAYPHWHLSKSGQLYRPFKRGLDLLLASVCLPICLIFISALWVVVRLDGGPGFFGHLRVGRDGHAFRCWKIRSMVPNAEDVLATVLKSDPESAAQWATTQKLTRDPRVTRIGGFLRRSSLDELPQLLNVFRGEMSLVGPRPVTFEELERYGAKRGAYLAVRPGLTGLWQVSGRNKLSYGARVDLDETYTKEMSIFMDLRILLQTVGVVFLGRGM